MMTDSQIISAAREVGWNTEHAASNEYLIRFAKKIISVTHTNWFKADGDVKKAVEDEREACAQLCEQIAETGADKYKRVRRACATLIRERGTAHEKPTQPLKEDGDVPAID